MATKAQLQERIMELVSEMGHTEHRHAAHVRKLEKEQLRLEIENTKLRGSIRPYFLPFHVVSDGTKGIGGTAHCPVCEAMAPATLVFDPQRLHSIVATQRSIEHNDGCMFAVQSRSQ